MSLVIITTSDGSHSLLNESLQETYHSVHGAVQESNHVFIETGMAYWLDRAGKKTITILEIGFGTGLNAWLAFKNAMQSGVDVSYISLEAFPLDKSIWSALNYASDDEKMTFNTFHDSPWGTTVEIGKNFRLLKVNSKLEDVVLTGYKSDVVFFDAFAPSKQPDMWSIAMLGKVTSTLAEGGTFVTYCAKGQVKRDLKSLGLTIEALAGPPGKKRNDQSDKSFLIFMPIKVLTCGLMN